MKFEVGKSYLDAKGTIVEIMGLINGSEHPLIAKAVFSDGMESLRMYTVFGESKTGYSEQQLVSEYTKPRVVYLNLEENKDGLLSCFLSELPSLPPESPTDYLIACVRVEFKYGQFDS